MNVTAKITAALGLVFTIAPSFLVLNDVITWQAHANLMAVGMVLWFLGASFEGKHRGAKKNP